VVTLCNWNGNAHKRLGFTVSQVPGLPKAARYAAFEFRTQKFLGVVKAADQIELDLDAHAARVIRLTPLQGNGTYFIGGDLNLSSGMEIERVVGKKITLKPALRVFASTFTFLDWKDGTGSIHAIKLMPNAGSF